VQIASMTAICVGSVDFSCRSTSMIHYSHDC